jgi:hypothetical protein
LNGCFGFGIALFFGLFRYPKTGSVPELQAHISQLAMATRRATTPQLLSLLKDGLASLMRSLLHPAMHPVRPLSSQTYSTIR